MIIVAEITVAIDAAGTLKTFLFSTDGWTTETTDTPASTWVQPRLLQAANFRRELFSGNRTFGAVRGAYGECKLSNIDGGLDSMIRYGFDGQAFTLRAGEVGAPYPGSFTTLLVCTMQTPWFELTETSGAVHIKLTDRIQDLEKPVASALYAGTGGAEGLSSAAGARKPLVFGSIFQCKPVPLNDVLWIYSYGAPPAGQAADAFAAADGQGAGLQWCNSAGASNPPAYGVAIDCATYAILAAAPVPPGGYAVCSALGLIKLGSKPSYDLTCSVRITDLATWSATTHAGPGTIIADIAAAVGVTNINAADVAALDAARSAVYGCWCGSEETAVSVMAKIANSVSAWFGYDRLNQLRVGLFDAPAGTPVFTFTPNNVTKLQRLDNQVDAGVPVWSVVARTQHNDFPQSTFANSVPLFAQAWFNVEWPRQVPATTPATKTKYPNAKELVIDVHASTASDQGEAARRLALYGAEREMVQVTAPLTLALLTSIDLGAITSLRWPRFGWDGGKLMRVVAVAYNFDSKRLEITLWG